MHDETEQARRARQAELNEDAASREALEKSYGDVWSTGELGTRFTVIGFLAPYVIVKDRLTGKKGSLEFQHSPRFYFNLQYDE
jgi:hypothetical protein